VFGWGVPHVLKKPRKTLAKQIAALDKSGQPFEAIELAIYGRVLTAKELLFKDYYGALDRLEAAMRGKRILKPLYGEFDSPISDADLAGYRTAMEEPRNMLIQWFMRAVDSHDKNEVLEIANSIWFFKDKRHSQVDRIRVRLVFLKLLLQYHGKTATITQVASFVGLEDLMARKRLETPEDGYSALRRMCKSLGVPLEKASRKLEREDTLEVLEKIWAKALQKGHADKKHGGA